MFKKAYDPLGDWNALTQANKALHGGKLKVGEGLKDFNPEVTPYIDRELSRLAKRLNNMFGPTAKATPLGLGLFSVYPNKDYSDAERAAWFYNHGNAPTSEQIKLSNKVIENRAKWRNHYSGDPDRMSFTPSLAKQYITPSGDILDVPETARALGKLISSMRPRVLGSSGTPTYRLSEDRAHASLGKFIPGRVKSSAPMSTYAHEGIIPSNEKPHGISGHFAENTGPDTEGLPILLGKLKGLPRFVVNNTALGGDYGIFAQALHNSVRKYKKPIDTVINWDGTKEWMKAIKWPLSIGEAATKMLRGDNPLHGYFNSVTEFVPAANNIKFMGANKGVDVSEFDPDKPDLLLDGLKKVDSLYRADKRDKDKLSPYAPNIGLPQIIRHFERYKELHNKPNRNRQEEYEYRHIRRSLPALWNQARNNRQPLYWLKAAERQLPS